MPAWLRSLTSRGARLSLAGVALCIGIVLSFILLELGTRVYFKAKTGAWDGHLGLLDESLRRLESTHGSRLKHIEGDCTWAEMFRSHPFFGYVLKKTGPCAESDVNRQGFLGGDFPLERDAGIFTILVTGGSVAFEAIREDASRRSLEDELNAGYEILGKRRFRVLNGALPAWRMPKSLFVLALNAQAIDAVLSIEGFNEFGVFEEGNRRLLDFPSDPLTMKGVDDVLDLPRALSVTLDGAIFRWELESPWRVRSAFLVWALEAARGVLRTYAKRSSGTGYGYLFAVPEDWDQARTESFNLSRYKHFLKQFNLICLGFGLKELHYFQPVPALEKRLSPEERQVVGDISYGAKYLWMVESLLKWGAESGVPLATGVRVFRDVQVPVYRDQIHLHSKGKAVMQDHLIELMKSKWGLKRKST